MFQASFVRLPDRRASWLQAVVPFETGSDGRSSTMRFNLLLATNDRQ